MYEEIIKRLREAPYDWPDASLHYEAADAIEELYAINQRQLLEIAVLMTKPRWIPVTERLPEKDQTVLAYCAEDNFCYISRMHQSFEDYDVTHWIPLPQMPKEERA